MTGNEQLSDWPIELIMIQYDSYGSSYLDSRRKELRKVGQETVHWGWLEMSGYIDGTVSEDVDGETEPCVLKVFWLNSQRVDRQVAAAKGSGE